MYKKIKEVNLCVNVILIKLCCDVQEGLNKVVPEVLIPTNLLSLLQ